MNIFNELNRFLIGNGKYFQGNWELQGNVSSNDSGLTINKGSALCNNRLPSSNYIIRIKLESLSGFQIRLKERFFDPSNCIAFVFKDKSVELIVNQSIIEEKELKGTIEEIVISNLENQLKLIINNETVMTRTSNVKYWLSIVANRTHISSLEMRRTDKKSNELQDPVPKKSVAVSLKDNAALESVSNTVKAVNALTDAVDNIASVAFVNDILSKEIIPFTDAWQRRSITIMRTAQRLREGLKQELDRTEARIMEVQKDIFNLSIDLLSDVSDELMRLYDGVMSEEFVYNAKLRQHRQETFKAGRNDFLFFIGLLETAVVSFWFISNAIDSADQTQPKKPAALSQNNFI